MISKAYRYIGIHQIVHRKSQNAFSERYSKNYLMKVNKNNNTSNSQRIVKGNACFLSGQQLKPNDSLNELVSSIMNNVYL